MGKDLSPQQSATPCPPGSLLLLAFALGRLAAAQDAEVQRLGAGGAPQTLSPPKPTRRSKP